MRPFSYLSHLDSLSREQCINYPYLQHTIFIPLLDFEIELSISSLIKIFFSSLNFIFLFHLYKHEGRIQTIILGWNDSVKQFA